MIQDRDPGDEHEDSHWISYPMSHRFGGIYQGMASSLFWECYVPVEEDHDGGDEDDYMNYRPSVNPETGIRLWAPRDL